MRRIKRHVFLSYVRENSSQINRLASDLRAKKTEVWLDRDQIGAGDRWKDEIRKAIKSGHLFVACFSQAYAERDKAFMNEELTLAIEELRQLRPDRAWFIPVSIDGSAIPPISISNHETIHDLQWVDLSEDWDAGVARISQAAATVD